MVDHDPAGREDERRWMMAAASIDWPPPPDGVTVREASDHKSAGKGRTPTKKTGDITVHGLFFRLTALGKIGASADQKVNTTH